ncbi:MAG: hypothetical protein ACKPJD_02985, partial [Planctomycetaceae bacterium]
CQLRLLIYGRDGYGSSAGLLSSAWKDKNLIRGLHCFIESLAEAGVQVIYMPLLPWRAEIRRNRESVQGGSPGSAKQPPLHDEILAEVREGALSKSDGAVFREISASSSVYLDSLKKVLHPFMWLSVGK